MPITPDKCPWCGAGEHRYYSKTSWSCGSRKGYPSRPPVQSDRCRICELEAKVDRLRAVFAAMAGVVAEQELPDGDPLDCSVPTMMWLEDVLKGAAAEEHAKYVEGLETKVERLRAALVLACTPPYKTGGTSGIADETLVRFFLRQAAESED